jgi:hypothetical protein
MSTTAPPLNTRAMPVQVIDANEAEGRIIARVLRYEVVDSYRTIFAPGCADRRLSERMPVVLNAHQC